MSSSDEIHQAIRQWAPELDADEVRAFMDDHDKPDDESEPHAVWAVKIIRERADSQFRDGPSQDTVVDAIRDHDEAQG